MNTPYQSKSRDIIFARMWRVIFSPLILLLLTILPAIAQPPTPPEGFRWVVNHQYSDEFNGNSLDDTKWNDTFEGWKGRQPASFESSSVSVSGGNMQIKNAAGSPQAGYSISGGAVQSKGVTAHFGYYECKFKASKINMSTTFWMSSKAGPEPRTADGNDSYSQELDICESIGGTGNFSSDFRKKMKFNTHYRLRKDPWPEPETFYSAGNNQVEIRDGDLIGGDASLVGSESWEDYHTYGCHWRNAQEAAFYVDGRFIGVVNFRTDVVSDPFKDPMRINMVTETYNWAKPYPTTAELNNDAINTSYYDWVRSYKLIPINETVAGNNPAVNIFGQEVGFVDFNVNQTASNSYSFDLSYKANSDKDLYIIIKNENGGVVGSQKYSAYAGFGMDGYALNLSSALTNGQYTVTTEIREVNGSTVVDSESKVMVVTGGDDSSPTGPCDDISFEEKNGIVAFEAEDFFSQELTSKREWFVIGNGTTTPTPDPDPAHTAGASGGKYVEILPDTRVTHDDPLVVGESFSNTPGVVAVLNYKVHFNTTGRYYVWVRAYSTGSEDNGVHVGLDGTWPASGARMQWCTGKNQWTWESKQRTDANHCGEAEKIYLDINTPGDHIISFSMREDGFEMDKMVLSKVYSKPTDEGPAVATIENCNDGGDGTATDPTGVVTSGELKRWHKVTLTMDGPNTNETANPNPFSDYRCDVTFTHTDGKSYTVPGYYAACDDPTAGCSSGNKWKAHFAPDRTGTWTYTIAFKSGSNVAINGGGTSAGFMDGKTGTWSIAESDKSGRDHRAANKGRLQYVGEHYLRYSGTGGNNPNGDYFIKAGADAPENTLAYDDFDNTPNRGNRRKSWSPHQQDYSAADASGYTWGNGKGTELLGVVNYLHNKGVNAFSFLTLSLHGDDENVFPHLMKVNEATYNGYNDANQWSQGVHHDRFDVSKLAQWEKIFEYGDKKGMYMHFKTMETENDNIMDGNTNGRERKLYYRELIARFGHHLALNWNITEETTIPDNVVKSIATYIKTTDAYDHNIVLHTYPDQKDQRYTPLLGNNSDLTGASLQIGINNVHNEVKEWIDKSRNAGKKWVCANDEQGSANIGVDQDPTDNKKVRQNILWGTLLAGGAGVEYYYGYQTGETDLTAQNHRSRDSKYSDASYAINFFNDHFQQYLPNTLSQDGATAATDDYVLNGNDQAFAIYRPNGGTTAITLPGSGWSVQWFNPRTGGNLTAATSITNSLVAPDNNDWVALVTNGTVVDPNDAPTVSFADPLNNASFLAPADIQVTVNAGDADGSVANVKLYLDNVLVRQESAAPYNWGQATQNDVSLQNLPFGTYELKAIATDDEGATAQAIITISVTSDDITEVCVNPIHDAYLQGTTKFNTADLRVENGNRVSYLMFDLSAVTGNVLSSKLTLGVSNDAGNGNIDVNLGTTNTWTEANLSSANAPAKGALLGNLNTTYAIGATYDWELSGLSGGGNTSLIVTHTSGNDVSFGSKEGATLPKLCLIVENESTDPIDCNGDANGTASIDQCGVCSGGNTGVTPNSTCLDCNGDINGTASIDACGVCSGGNTGVVASSPTTWYADADNDGLGDPAVSVEDCTQPAGYVANSDDDCPNDATNSCNVVYQPIPGLIEAESFSSQFGIQTQATTDVGGGQNVGYIQSGDYVEFTVDVAQSGTYDVSYRVASSTTGGNIVISLGASNLSTTAIAGTGGWQTWNTVTDQVTFGSGEQTIRLTFTGGTGYLFNLNWIEFIEEVVVTDCNGDVNGTASIDACGVCSGGNTGVVASSPTTWYADADNDGLGDPAVSVEDCIQPTGYVANSNDDCPNDATNTCNDPVDCNGDVNGTASIDACGVCSGGNTGVVASSPTTWYADVDGDGAGDSNSSVEDCNQPTGYVAIAGDQCVNDGNKTVPGDCGCGVEEGTCDNIDPTVSITSPSNNAVIIEGSDVSINLSANDTDGSIVTHQIFVNGQLVDTDGANFTPHVITGISTGTYVIRAVVTDNDGGTAEATVSITVEAAETDVCDAPVYDPNTIYDPAGMQVIFEQKLYQNKWYTQGNEPGDVNGPWELIGFCGADPLDCSGLAEWSASTAYSTTGTQVVHNGVWYSNRWYSSGIEPGTHEVWEYIGPCTEASMNSLKVTTVGLADAITKSELSIYPNPIVQGSLFNLISDGSRISTVTIINSVGESVLNLNDVNSNKAEITLSNQSAGIYFVKVILENGTLRTVQVLVE